MFEKLGNFVARRRKGVFIVFILDSWFQLALAPKHSPVLIVAAIAIHRVTQPKLQSIYKILSMYGTPPLFWPCIPREDP